MGEKSQKQKNQLKSYHGQPEVVKSQQELQNRLRGEHPSSDKFWKTFNEIMGLKDEKSEPTKNEKDIFNEGRIRQLEHIHSSIGSLLRILKGEYEQER